MKRLIVCGIAICLCLYPVAAVAGGEQNIFVIGLWHIGEDQCDMPEVEAILTEAYQRIGATVTFRCLPPKRDLVWADNLTIDASALRDKEVLRDHPNLVEVPVPLFQYSLCAFTANPDLTIHTWDDLQGHKVGATLGKMAPGIMLRRHSVDYQDFVSPVSAVSLLHKRRLEVFVHDCLSCKHIIQKLQLKDIISQPLYTGYAYHILNRKHEHIIPRLSDAFTDMIQDGTLKRLAGRFVPYLPGGP